jgi:hypothetical protein
MPSAPAIQPIPTRYQGYHFRSRLEARWAVFFDTLGLRWEYEPEGFDLGGVLYLPDFRVWTPQGEPCWYEVKSEGVAEDTKFSTFREHVLMSMPERTAHRCGRDYGARVTMLCGDPQNHLSLHGWPCTRCGSLHSYVDEFKPMLSLSEVEYGQYCGPCDWEMSISGETGNGVAGVAYQGFKGVVWTPRNGFNWLKYQTESAMRCARSARFEHGESGAT